MSTGTALLPEATHTCSADPSVESCSSVESSRSNDYRTMLGPYRQSRLGRSLVQLVTSLCALLVLWVSVGVSLHYSYLLALVLTIPTAGLLVRLFVLQHDCGHGSFFKSKAANDAVGRALSVLTLTPYDRWRKNHAIHHATSGDLDRRGCGDVHMLTVREYRELSSFRRFVYRVHRHPLVLFGIGPFLYFVVFQRFTRFEPWLSKKERLGVHWTNLALLGIVVSMSWLIGLKLFLLAYIPVVAIAASAGAWLFYVQHHFESSYWRRHERWDYFDAGLDGSSYYELPAVLRWFTADIGLHHVHHLDSQIPNYRLQESFDENPALQQVRRLTLRESLSCASLKLWDEEKSAMVGISA